MLTVRMLSLCGVFRTGMYNVNHTAAEYQTLAEYGFKMIQGMFAKSACRHPDHTALPSPLATQVKK